MESKECSAREIIIADFSRCTEHPFSTIMKIMECTQKYGGEYRIKVPKGTVPMNLLVEYCHRFNVEFDMNEEDDFIEFVFKRIE